jgi:nitrogenase cofactor biosynthesis protein NifB
LPVGLRDTDAFIRLLTEETIKSEVFKKTLAMRIPHEIEKERGRYLDAMVDSHKYNAEGRAVIFGEPDFVCSTARLCLENGITPVVMATGAKCELLETTLRDQVHEVSDRFFTEDFIIADNCDFDHIEEYAVKYKANLMIGSSDGRRIEEKLGIPLVRCAFPIHDHVGGQRIRTLGYEGSIMLLDRITNTMLSIKEHSFRGQLFQKYYMEEQDKEESQQPIPQKEPENAAKTLEDKTRTHPCFSGCASDSARIHLPVAKKCNIQCNYCLRKYDCPNESRPGVTTRILTPEEALKRYLTAKSTLSNLNVVGIAGPGDSLADFEFTKKTLALIREQDPDVTFCISTNGLMLPIYIDDLVKLGVSHVTVTINAVDPVIGSKIYKTVNYMGVTYTGEAAAGILLGNQLTGLKMLQERGIVCKVNIVMLKEINDTHIPEVVKKVKELGCFITNIMQMIPVAGSAFENMPLTSNMEIMEMRQNCGIFLNQMYHCRQCRADATGTLDNDVSLSLESSLPGCQGSEKPNHENEMLNSADQNRQDEYPRKPEGDLSQSGESLLFAVASKGGILVDQHFGHVSDFYIFEYRQEGVQFLERRSVAKYCNGPDGCGGNGKGQREGNSKEKLNQIFDTIKDCSCVVAMRIGESPKQKLADKGIVSMMYYGKIEDAVAQAASVLLTKKNSTELFNKSSQINGYRKEAIS